MRVTFVPADESHVAAIAANARAQDVAEVWASNRYTMAEALRAGLKVSSRAWTATVDGEPVAMVGVAPYDAISGIGIAWMLGTSTLDTAGGRRAVMRCTKPVLDTMRDLYPGMLFNVVDASSRRAIRFLQWAGFQFHPWVPVNGHRFYPFSIQGASHV